MGFALLLLSSTEGWSLPPCPESGVWNNCFGTYTTADGTKYVGEWKDDKSHGQGTETYASGDKYVGEFKDGNFHGQGTYTRANGNKYVGEFKDGKRHGQSIKTYAGVNKYTTIDHGVSHSKSYGYTTNTEVVRKGQESQRFEIRHGDCGTDGEWSDCNNDRRRIERYVEPTSSEKPEGVAWYSWSLYLPEDFQQLNPSNTTLGQVKINGYREPLWLLNGRRNWIKIIFDASDQQCKLIKIEDVLGQWTDFLMKVDYSTDEETDKLYSEIYINGNYVNCEIDQPVLTKQVLRDRRKHHKRLKINFRYGIYNSYVSRWLDLWRTKSPDTDGFSDKHGESGKTPNSVTNKPWEFDWGVKLPTQVVYYDEVRIGSSREEVDINLNNPVD